MKNTMNNVNYICYSINRRIYVMDYQTETNVREYLNSELNNCDKLFESDVNNIAELLDVNENCIFDLLNDLELIG